MIDQMLYDDNDKGTQFIISFLVFRFIEAIED